MNKIFLSGNLTRDFESGATSSFNYARAGIAVHRRFSKNDEVDFFDIVAFNKMADICAKNFSKGRKVFIEGRLQTNSYTDKDGNKRTGYSVIIDNIEFGDSKKKGNDGDNYAPPPNLDDIEVPF